MGEQGSAAPGILRSERAQDSQIAAVPLAVVTDRCLENHRHRFEPRFVEQAFESLQRQLTGAEIGMSIASGTEWVARVVEMEATGLLRAEEAVDLGDEVVIPGRLIDGVPGGEGVTGIETDPQPAGSIGELDDRGEVVETEPDESSLPGCILQQDAGVAGRAQIADSR